MSRILTHHCIVIKIRCGLNLNIFAMENALKNNPHCWKYNIRRGMYLLTDNYFEDEVSSRTHKSKLSEMKRPKMKWNSREIEKVWKIKWKCSPLSQVMISLTEKSQVNMWRIYKVSLTNWHSLWVTVIWLRSSAAFCIHLCTLTHTSEVNNNFTNNYIVLLISVCVKKCNVSKFI